MSIGFIMFGKAIVLAAFAIIADLYKAYRRSRPRGVLVFCRRTQGYIDPVLLFEKRVKTAALVVGIGWLSFTALVMWQVLTAPAAG